MRVCFCLPVCLCVYVGVVLTSGTLNSPSDQNPGEGHTRPPPGQTPPVGGCGTFNMLQTLQCHTKHTRIHARPEREDLNRTMCVSLRVFVCVCVCLCVFALHRRGTRRTSRFQLFGTPRARYSPLCACVFVFVCLYTCLCANLKVCVYLCVFQHRWRSRPAATRQTHPRATPKCGSSQQCLQLGGRRWR